MSQPEVAAGLYLHFLRQNIFYTDGAAHESQPVKSRKLGRYLRQGGSWLKFAPAASALAQTTDAPTCRPPSLRPSLSFSPEVHQATCQIVAWNLIVSINQGRREETTQLAAYYGSRSNS